MRPLPVLELSAPKPGNVHRGADFRGHHVQDFAASAVALGPIMERALEQPLGHTVLEAVEATRQVAGTNTNLGIILLLVPLAELPRESTFQRRPAGVVN